MNMAQYQLKGVKPMRNKTLEALLYIQGDDGLTLNQIKEIFELNTIDEARKVIKDFIIYYNNLDLGLKVVNFNDVYKLATRETARPFIEKMVSITRRQKLSPAAMEVVGIVAYKQPITRSGINAIRGVDSSQVLSSLLAKKVVEEVGVSPTPGSPVLFGVTNRFYDYFRIKSMNELPKLTEFDFAQGVEDPEDFDLFTSQRHDN